MSSWRHLLRSNALPVHLTACLLSLTQASSCAPPRQPAVARPSIQEGPCRLFPQQPRRRAVGFADFSAARVYHSHVGVMGVGHFGHHFTVWYSYIEPTMLHVWAHRGEDGRLALVMKDGGWGGLAVAPKSIPPIPPRIAAIAREVKAELCSRCSHICRSKMAYDGTHRVVSVIGYIPHKVEDRDAQPLGWLTGAEVRMDQSLSRIIRSFRRPNRFDAFRVSADTRWFTVLPDVRPGRLLSPEMISRLANGIAKAARLTDAGAPIRTLSSLFPVDAPEAAPDVVSRVVAKITLRGRSAPRGASGHGLLAHFNLRNAVFYSGATAEAQVLLGQDRYKLRARLTPRIPRTPALEQTMDIYSGKLFLRVIGPRGRTWSRSYLVYGRIHVEGDRVVTHNGLKISVPEGLSSATAARRGQLPASPPHGAVDLQVAEELYQDFGR